MASHLAYDGLLAAVRVIRLTERLSTGPREVVVPEKPDLNVITSDQYENIWTHPMLY
jgi:hypothetical protein